MQRSFDVQEAPEIEIRLVSGDIQVDATLDGRVEVELVAYDDESQRLVDDARIELHGSRLLVEVPKQRGFNFGFAFGRTGIGCRVRCPEGSSLVVRTKSADLQVRGSLDGLNVASASGDIEAEVVHGDATVKSASGDLRLRSVAGSLSVQTASGDAEIGSVGGDVTVHSASGDVVIGEAWRDVSVNTVSGDQEHSAVHQGSVSAHSVSGDVHIGVRRGSKVYLDCNTVSGDTSSELEVTSDAPGGDGPLVEIRAKTVSGDIRITRAPAPANEHQEVHA